MLKDEPTLPAWLEEIWSGFRALSARRRNTAVPTDKAILFLSDPISYTEIAAFCSLHHVVDRELFIECVIEMDSLWMQNQRQKEAEKAK